MKRMVVLFLLLASATLAANAAYIIQLRNGKIISADDKVFVKDDMAYFTRRGVFFYLPASQVDLEASEKANTVVPTTNFFVDTPEAAPAVVTPAAKSAVISDEQLDIIRKRSRLANEGQFKPAAAPEAQNPSAPGSAPAAKPEGGGANREEAQSKMNSLLQRQSALQKDQTNLQNQLSTLKESFNSSPQQGEKEKLDSQIQSLSSQLADVQNSMTAVQGEIQSTQQQLSATPIVVDMNEKH